MSLVSASSDIIPGLPDDLALRCLAKLSHGFHGLLECVSKRWRAAVRSLDYSRLQSLEGWCGDWLLVLIDTQWNAYDPEADRWHPLPMYPSVGCDFRHLGFSCVSINNRFLVIGGYHSQSGSHLPDRKASVTNEVVQFDPYKKQWSRLASMHTERADFACAVVCGKVYVGGGWNSSSLQLDVAEVYDPVEDRWEDLPRLPMLREHCFGLSYEGRFHVFRGRKHRAQHITCKVFDPSDNRWDTVKDVGPFTKEIPIGPIGTMIVGDSFYIVDEGDGNSIKTITKDQQGWETLGRIPPVFLRSHSRPLESFGFGLARLRGDLYVVGGKVVKWNESQQRFDIVKLDLVRVCSLSASPLKWREARAMRSCGVVQACTFLKE